MKTLITLILLVLSYTSAYSEILRDTIVYNSHNEIMGGVFIDGLKETKSKIYLVQYKNSEYLKYTEYEKTKHSPTMDTTFDVPKDIEYVYYTKVSVIPKDVYKNLEIYSGDDYYPQTKRIRDNEILRDTLIYDKYDDRITEYLFIETLKNTTSKIYLIGRNNEEYLKYVDTLNIIHSVLKDTVEYEKTHINTSYINLSLIPKDVYKNLRLSGRIYKEDSIYFRAKGSEYSRIYSTVLKNTKLPVTFETLRDTQYASVSYDNIRYFITLDALYDTDDVEIENPYIKGYGMVVDELGQDSLKFFEYLKRSTTFKSYFYDTDSNFYKLMTKDFITTSDYPQKEQILRFFNTNQFKELFEDLKRNGLVLDNNIVENFYKLQYVEVSK